MTHPKWIVAAALLLPAVPALAGPGLGYAHDDVTYPEDVAQEEAPVRRVEVTLDEKGAEPAQIDVKAGERLLLVLTRRPAPRAEPVRRGDEDRSTP